MLFLIPIMKLMKHANSPWLGICWQNHADRANECSSARKFNGFAPTRQRQGEGDSVKSFPVVVTGKEADVDASFSP